MVRGRGGRQPWTRAPADASISARALQAVGICLLAPLVSSGSKPEGPGAQAGLQ